MKLSENVAFALHEKWRQTRLNEDGSYEPRWKKINDTEFIAKFEGKDLPSYVRNAENGYEIDIANACYFQLSTDWQNENRAAGEVVAQIIEKGKQLPRNKIGTIIHRAWLERNAWAKGGELGVSFKKLPKEEQDKDLDQYDVALTMSNAKDENQYLINLDEVIDYLAEAKKNGQNIAYKFNGHVLYSEFDTPDTCYLKVCGMTREEKRIYDEKMDKRYQEMKAKRDEETAEALKTIPEWKKRGESLIYPERIEEWYNCVESRFNDLYQGSDLINAVEIMEALEQGKPMEEAIKIAEAKGHSGSSWAMMMRIVTTFSKQGPAFYRANHKDIDPESEKYLQKLESENEYLGKMHSIDQDFDR